MISRELFIQMLRDLNSGAIQLLKKKKRFHAHAFFLMEDGESKPGMKMMPFDPANGGSDLRAVANQLGPSGVVTVCESWLRDPVSMEVQSEVLVMSAEHKSHGQLLVTNTIRRSSTGKLREVENGFDSFMDLVESGTEIGVEGRLTHLLSDSPINGWENLPCERYPGYRSAFKDGKFTLH